MSGIYGAWRWRDAIPDEQLAAWVSGIDEPGHLRAQPLERGLVIADAGARATETDLTAVLDGVLYEPEPGGPRVALEAYVTWGERFAEHLVGEYAVAIWDGRRGHLVLARDHIGARPLYLWRSNDTLVFGTRLRHVLAFPGVPAQPDEEAVAALLTRDHGFGRTRSLFQDVEKVPPGHVVVIDGGGRRCAAAHWEPGRRSTLRLASPRDYADALRESVERAVADAAASGGAVGAHVSGGLDSSSVAVLGQAALRRRGTGLAGVFSWSPGGRSDDPGDERRRVEEIAQILDLPVTWGDVTVDDVRRATELANTLEGNYSLRREIAVLRKAADAGIDVLLSGWGGDEVVSFNGRGQLPGLLLRGRWGRLGAEVTASARRAGRTGSGLARAVGGQLWTRAVLPLVPDRVQRRGLGGPALERALRREGVSWADVHPRAAEHWRRGKSRVPFTSSQRVQISLFARGYLTARMESWAAAAAPYGIQHRYPLVDRRVVDLVLSFPGDLWIHDGWGRWLYRAAMDGLLPASIVWGTPKDEPAFSLLQFPDLGADDPPPATPAWPAVERMFVEGARVRKVEAALVRRRPA